jgi:predicted Zn finger-like uncharacterized protein
MAFSGEAAMFLYTVCPGCQAGYDVTDLLRGKKIRCKSCAQPFSVAAVPRPRHLPPPAAFARPHTQAAPTGISARPLAAFPEATPPRKLGAIIKGGRPGDRLPRPTHRPQGTSNAASWLGRGGVSVLVIIVIVALRACAGFNSRNYNTATFPPYTAPPPKFAMPKQPQFDQNLWKGMQFPKIQVKPLDPRTKQQDEPLHFRLGPRRDGKLLPIGGAQPNKDGRPARVNDDPRLQPASRRDRTLQAPVDQHGLPPPRKD